jgi:type IV pilus assembly protein PilF
MILADPRLRAAARRAFAPAALAFALAGCTTTSTTTALPGESSSAAARSTAPADPADAERRARVRVELAAGYFARGQTDIALEEIRLALVAKPDFADAYNLRGLVYASMEDVPKAEDSFRRALQINPRDADVMHNWGWVMCRQGRYAEADAMFERALAQPRYTGVPRTLLARGACQARDGRWEEAERTLSRAYELDPSNPATAFNLSEVLLRRGEYERARFYIGRVNAQPDQSNAQTLWLAARIEHRLGNAEGVANYGRQLRTRFPQSPEALAFERGRFND